MSAFQASFYRDGYWQTQTVGLLDVVKAHNTPKTARKTPNLDESPCGVLTQTVIESPMFNSILPVRLRSLQHNDVVFVGKHSIHVRELQDDGQFHEVIKKDDFSARIRNAAVIGSVADELSKRPNGGADWSSQEGTGGLARGALPPQMLMLALQNGETVFLFVRQAVEGGLEFVVSSFREKVLGGRLAWPGFHLAVDPSSRFMARAFSQELVIVHQLESLENLSEQYAAGQALQPIQVSRPRSVQAVIQNVEFLYPEPDQQDHIILALFLVRDKKTRVVTYDWRLGEDLTSALSEEKPGYELQCDIAMPTLLIPLALPSAFIALTKNCATICSGFVTGQVEYEDVSISVEKTREDGSAGLLPDADDKAPLWSAWARGSRLTEYVAKEGLDSLYIAREDGAVVYMEFAMADNQAQVKATVALGKVTDCNIYTAFACLYAPNADILVVGGDSGPGAVWKAEARSKLVRLPATLPNWSSVADLVTTDESETWYSGDRFSWDKPKKQDRIFSVSGRWQRGYLAEYRLGLEARITHEIDCGTVVSQAWIFPADFNDPSAGSYLLLSMPGRSCIEHIAADNSQEGSQWAMEDDNEGIPSDNDKEGNERCQEDDDQNPFDVSSRTLEAARTRRNRLTQITETHISIISRDKKWRKVSHEEVLPNGATQSVSAAISVEDMIALSAHSGTKFRIHVLQVDDETLLPALKFSLDMEGEVTSLSIAPGPALLACVWQDGRPLLFVLSLDDGVLLQTLDLCEYLDKHDEPEGHALTEPIASAVTYRTQNAAGDLDIIVLGTRGGDVITITKSGKEVSVAVEKFGWTTAYLSLRTSPLGNAPALLVCCDEQITLMTNFKAPRLGDGRFNTKSRIWPFDAADPQAARPIDRGTIVDHQTGAPDTTRLLFVSGARVLLGELQGETPRSVHRSFPISGTPTKAIYSKNLRCVIVATELDDRHTLRFIDPDTGKDMGVPTDAEGKGMTAISGLTTKTDKILALGEWEYKKEGKVWRFILASTKSGKVLVISAERRPAENGDLHTIRFWTRFKRVEKKIPVYSVLGFEAGIMYCAGHQLCCDILVDKKLNRVGQYTLRSPAVGLRMVNGRVLALTSKHSYFVLSGIPTSAEEAGSEGGETPKVKTLTVRYADAYPRETIEVLEVTGLGCPPSGGIIMASDRSCRVSGSLMPWHPLYHDNLRNVFQADLRSSIRSLRRGKVRPIWQQSERASRQHNKSLSPGDMSAMGRYGRLLATVDDADIIGGCIDGSLVHFTLLDRKTFRFLRFLQNLTSAKLDAHPNSPQPEQDDDEKTLDPSATLIQDMHVDGDALRRSLKPGLLADMVSSLTVFERFRNMLLEVNGTKNELGEMPSREECFGLTEQILEYFLQPVL